MQYLGLAVIVALLAFTFALIAVRILARGHWLLGWLRGTFGMVVVAAAVLIGLIAWDIASYQPLNIGAPQVLLSFKADGQQRYQVKVEEGRNVRFATLEGDLWQLEVRALHWKGIAALIGLEPGFRLERLSGRYLAVEQQDHLRHPFVTLAESRAGVDFWHWLQRCQCAPLLIEAQPRRIRFLPLEDGAEYQVELTPTGLLAKPANLIAEQAMKEW